MESGQKRLLAATSVECFETELLEAVLHLGIGAVTVPSPYAQGSAWRTYTAFKMKVAWGKATQGSLLCICFPEPSKGV